ncbi:MAG: ABC transporter ATP-binding protein [Ruminococcaceae bacterium]|nr:ABC transporter ATP-binding protein [Oscillospiraceae bacterium]
MIKAENIRKSYGLSDNGTEVLKGVSLEVGDGDTTVILGASGSGKSTLLNVVSGLERPDSGSVLYDGEDILGFSDDKLTAFRKRKIGFIFQQYYLLPNLTVDRNVKMGAELAGNKNYAEIIDALGLSEKKNKFPYELSGGEQQRVSAARALAKKPEVLFLDEPTGALDEETGRSVLDYIYKLQNELKFTIIMVTHNANIAETVQNVIKMNSGRIIGQYRNETRKTAYEIGW